MTRSIQVFPGGWCATISEDGDEVGPGLIRRGHGREMEEGWREPTAIEGLGIRIQERAEVYLEGNILKCQSALVDALTKMGEHNQRIADAFCVDEIENIYRDTSEWTAEQCRNYLLERHSNSEPDLDELDEDDWRRVANDAAMEDPQDPLEWWLVSEWLCGQFRDIGEVVIDNEYGCWWGRTCSGQVIIMDGTLQRIAAKFQ
jgi:hypothetical protein